MGFRWLAQMARTAERGKLDAMFFQDSAAVVGSAGLHGAEKLQHPQRAAVPYRAGVGDRGAGGGHVAYRADLDLHDDL